MKLYTNYPLLFVVILCIGILPTKAYSAECFPSTPISCGSTIWNGALKTNKFNISNYNLYGCKGSLSSFNGNDSLFILDIGPSAKDVSIVLSGMSADLDLFVFKSCTDHYGNFVFSSCQGNSLNPHNNKDSVFISNASGKYYVVVDAYKAGLISGFELKVNCNSPTPISVCHYLPEIHCNERVIHRNDYYDPLATDIIDSHPECSGDTNLYKGFEIIYKLNGHYGSLHNVTVDLYSLSHYVDHDLFVYRNCSMVYDPVLHDWKPVFSDLINECHYGHASPYGIESALINYIGPHDEVYIVVEGKKKGYGPYYHTGNFELVISCGDICDQKITDLACNGSIESSTEYSKNYASYYVGDPGDNPGNNWGPEKTFRFEIEEKTDIEIELDILNNADLNLYLLDGCGARYCIAYGKEVGEGKDEIIKRKLYPGTYYIVVEGYRGDWGKFRLSLKGCKCKNAVEIFCDKTVKSTTRYGTNSFDKVKNHCFMNSSDPLYLHGNDKTFFFRAPETKEYTFRLFGMDKNLDLFVLSNCKDENSCLGFSTRSYTEDEDVVLHLNKYEEVYLIVDSWSQLLSSDFSLLVECTPPPPCFTYSHADVGPGINLNLSPSNVNCQATNRELKAYKYLSPSGNSIDPSSEISITIDGNKAFFNPDETGIHYLICYSYKCGNQKYSCCKDVFVPGRIKCGQSFSSSTIGGKSEFDADDIQLCYNSSSNFKGPDQLVKLVKSSSSDIMTVTMYHSSSNLSLFILDKNLNPVNMSCKALNFNSSKKISNSNPIGEYYTDKDNPLPAGLYYALVEGFANDISSDFSLHLDCGKSCGDKEDISCDTIINGKTLASDLNDLSSYEFGGVKYVGYTGPENLYEFAIDAEVEMAISLSGITGSGSFIDLDLFLSSDCTGRNIIGKSTNPGTQNEEIKVTLQAGSYKIAVDGWNGSFGNYILSLNGCDNSSLLIASNRNGKTTQNASILKIAPNPFSDFVEFQLNAAESDLARVELMDLSGRIIYRNNHPVNKGLNNFALSSDELGSYTGLLFYRISLHKNEYRGKLIRIQ